MRLGVVLTGTGVYGAAGVGLLTALWQRNMEPYAVCGIGSGAWPAALYAAGCNAAQMELACVQAQRMGKRMLRKARSGLFQRKTALYTADGMQRLLQAQTSRRLLALCPRRAIFPVRAQRTGFIAFASPGCLPMEGLAPITQVSAAFAARASMGLPPFLEPLEWRGSRLLPMQDTGAAARLLLSAGAQRVLIVDVPGAPGGRPDPMLLAAACAEPLQESAIPGTTHLCVHIPEHISTLSFDGIVSCMEFGKRAAVHELDHLFAYMGMAFCRVLPFRKL